MTKNGSITVLIVDQIDQLGSLNNVTINSNQIIKLNDSVTLY